MIAALWVGHCCVLCIVRTTSQNARSAACFVVYVPVSQVEMCKVRVSDGTWLILLHVVVAVSKNVVVLNVRSTTLVDSVLHQQVCYS